MAGEMIPVSDDSLVKEGSLSFAACLIFPFVLVFFAWKAKYMCGQNAC